MKKEQAFNHNAGIGLASMATALERFALEDDINDSVHTLWHEVVS